MKPATVHQLKNELKQLPAAELVELCLRLTKYKLENKELLNYLLFEADDEDAYARKIEEQVEELFKDIPRNNSVYFTKKSVRKILRLLNKHIKYSGQKPTEVQLRLHFCRCMKQYIRMQHSTVLGNIYAGQVKKIEQIIPKLHEDLQYDFEQELRGIED